VIIANAELLTIFSLAEVAFPRFSAAAHRGAEALAEELRLYLRSMLLITAPIASGCLAFGAPLARLLFERGEFDPESTAAVARILACLSPEVLFMGYFAVFWRLLLAKRRMSAIVWTSLGAMALNAILNALLMKPFGISGIALSTSGVTTVFALVLGYLVRREGLTILAPGERLFVLRVLASAALMGLVVFAGSSWFERTFDVQTEAARLAEVGGGLALGGLVYALSLLLLGIREVPDALGRLARTTAAWTRG
jgi:putative peptidoglycan lipid II flippase